MHSFPTTTSSSLKFCLAFLLLTFGFSAMTFAAPPFLWEKSVASFYGDIGHEITTDTNGNSYVLGSTLAPVLQVGSFSLTNAGETLVFLTKYDVNGTVVWAREVADSNLDTHYNLAGNIPNASLATDSQGNSVCFVTQTSSNSAAILSRWDSHGNRISAQQVGDAVASAGAIALDRSGNLFVSGTVGLRAPGPFEPLHLGDMTFESGTCFVAKYDASNNLIWVQKLVGDQSQNLATDTNGNCFIAGYFIQLELGTNVFTAVGSVDIFVAKIDPSGDVSWAKHFGGSQPDAASSTVTDESGNCYLAGYIYSPTISFDSITITNSSASCIFLAKLDPNGNVLWVKNSRGPGYQSMSSVSISLSGDIFLSGTTSSDFSFDSLTFSNPTLTNYHDSFVIKCNSGGEGLWMKQIVVGYPAAANLTVDLSGNSYVTGYFEAPGIFFDDFFLEHHAGTESYGNDCDMFIAKIAAVEPPHLLTTRSGNQLIFSWPTNAPGFILESTTNLALPNGWISTGNLPQPANGSYSVTNTISASAQYFRLRQP